MKSTESLLNKKAKQKSRKRYTFKLDIYWNIKFNAQVPRKKNEVTSLLKTYVTFWPLPSVYTDTRLHLWCHKSSKEISSQFVSSFLFSSLFFHRIATAVGLAWPVLISYESFERMKVAVQVLIMNNCMFWLFFVVSEFMFSMKAAIFLSVHVTIEHWTCIYNYFLVCFGHFLIQFGLCCLRTRAVLRVLFARSWNGANITASFSTRKTYPFMHKCNSTLNTLSSIANQAASLPLAMRIYIIYIA